MSAVATTFDFSSPSSGTGMVTRRCDPRSMTFVASSYYCGWEQVPDRGGGVKRRRKLYQTLIAFPSAAAAREQADRLRDDAVVMESGDIDAMRTCAIAAGRADPARLPPDTDAQLLQFVYPPRFNIEVLTLTGDGR